MPGKRYSAGAIFLQVVPVFANVQNAIQDEAKNIDRALGDQMERSGDKAGERAGKAASKRMREEIKKADIGGDLERQMREGVDGMERALSGVNTRNLGKKLRGEVQGMRKELEALKDIDINVDDNFGQVAARVAAVRAQIEEMRKRSKVFFDVKGLPEVYRAATKAQAAIDAIDGDIKLDVDTKAVDRKMGAFETKFKKVTKSAAQSLSGNMSKEAKKAVADLEYLSNLRIGIDISGDMARREIREIRGDLKKLTTAENEIQLRTDAGKAEAELAEFNAMASKIDGRDIEVDVKTNAKTAGHDADAAANSFRSFNIILLACVSVGPALIPILAGIAGGLIALGPAAAVAVAGLGSVLVGFSGIGDALTALQNKQDQSATNAQTNAGRQVSAAKAIEGAQDALADARRNAGRAAENAARAAADAAERVKDAREDAADAIEEALKRQKEAQEEYRDAVQEVKDAEQSLRDAREEARKDAETIAKRQRQNAVDERQAVMDLAEAQNEYNNVLADGSSTDADKEQAAINLEQAQIGLNDVRDEQVALSEEAADYAENGVDGSEKVQDAQDAVTDALEAQKDAQDAVKEAAEAADEARVDGAKAVQDALEDQQRVLEDNARSMADAKRAIGDAEEALSDARTSAVEDLQAINSQQQAVNAAFDKLGPAGRKFAMFLFGLKSGFYEFRDAVQEAMLPAVQRAIEGFIASPAADKARDAFVALAGAFGDFTLALSKSFQGPVWTKFFEMLAELGPQIQSAYGDAFISFMEAFSSILVTSAPFALRFAEGLSKMMDGFAKWAASKEGAKDIKDFIAYVEEIGPEVLDFFSGFARAAGNVARAIAPLGEVVLGLLDGFLNFIAELDPDTLGAIITAFTVILLASQVAYAVQNTTKALGALFATSIGPWAFLIVGIAAALVYLYETNEDFRKFVEDAWKRISKVIKKAWEQDIKPALDDLWDALQDLWKEVLQPFLEWLGPIIVWMFEKLFPLWAKRISFYIRAVTWVIKHVIIPVAKELAAEFKYGWEHVIKPAWEKLVAGVKWVKEKVSDAFNNMKARWSEFKTTIVNGWNRIQEIWDVITATALPALETAFSTVMENIGKLWDGLKAKAAVPIKFVIEKIINGGLIDGFNTISDIVHGPHIDHVKSPDWMAAYATGGVLPGYTPGRDPHKFVSPTGGRLELSGGEAIMRPEWTKAVGSGFVNQMNALARSGGVDAIRNAMGYASGGIMQAFAKGGIVFPVPGGYIERTDYNLGHDGMDINALGDSTGKVPYFSATSGRVTTTGYSRGYGNAVFVASPYGELVYGHGADGTIRVSPGQQVEAGTWLANIGNTGNSDGAHLHFGFPGGTFAAAESLLAGALPPTGKVGDGKRNIVPQWAKNLIAHPVEWAKGLIQKPIAALKEKFGGNPWVEMIAGAPKMLVSAVGKYAKSILPNDWGSVKDKLLGTSGPGDSLQAPGQESSLPGSHNSGPIQAALGGILPYNGAMMYDNGGYLAPGLTTVMNLTGKPEPVFTNEQFENMGSGDAAGIHYAPTFNKSDLTAADVSDDLDFTFRSLSRRGRYGRTP